MCPWDIEIDPEAERRLAEERKRAAEAEAAAAVAAAAARTQRVVAKERVAKLVQEMGEEDDDEYVPSEPSDTDSGKQRSSSRGQQGAPSKERALRMK